MMRVLSHLTFPKIIAFLLFGAILITFAPMSVKSTSQGIITVGKPVVTRSGLTIPENSYGIVYLRHAKEGQLMHLRGIAGEGTLLLRTDQIGICQKATVELVAGDFGGHSIGIRSIGPIALAIQSSKVAIALKNGNDIESDDIAVSDNPDDRQADIILLDGLHPSQGFILDPSYSFMNSIFKSYVSKEPCAAHVATRLRPTYRLEIGLAFYQQSAETLY